MLNIYLTNLGKYNEGELVGEWVELPISEEELEAVKQRIGINERYEEWFITDYETDIHGLTVGEYDSISALNELAEAIEEDPEKAEALIYWGYETAEEIRDNLDNVIYVTTPEGAESKEEAVGYYYAEECGCVNIPDNIKSYFDYERYGRDIMLDGQFYTTENGNIYELCA